MKNTRRDKRISTRLLLKRTLKYAKNEKKRFIIASILLVLNIVIDLSLPIFVSLVTNILTDFDPSLPSAFDIALRSIVLYVSGYALLQIINNIFYYFQTICLQKAGQRIIYQLRMEIFIHIENLPIKQFDEMSVGSLVTYITNYTTALSDLFATIFVNFINNILTSIGMYIVMLFFSPLLSIILLAVIILVFVLSRIFNKVINRHLHYERQTISNLNSFLNENLSGMKIIQLFSLEKEKEKEFNFENKALKNIRYKIITISGIYYPAISFLHFVAIAITFILGIQPWISLTAGEFVGFYICLNSFFSPIQSIADQFDKIQKAFTAIEKLFIFMDITPQILDKNTAKDISTIKGKIEFKNVWFAYKKDEWVLKNASFIIQPGQTVAFVGATGAGKTTILSLLVKNYNIQKGQILIDDMDIAEIKTESLRRLIGQMMQDVFLFTGDVRTNITLRDESYTDEQILNACKYVNADKFIVKLPNGLNEKVIKGGENFSQGQKQLLSFARTILPAPKLLMLDEATANIDTETEILIQDSLERMKSIGTMLVVAHRLSTIKKADQIFVLQNGAIVESGNHEDLLKRKGAYYALYKLQYEKNKNIL